MRHVVGIVGIVSACASTATPHPPIEPAKPPVVVETGPFAPHALAGPYDTIAAWCADLAQRMVAKQRAAWKTDGGTDDDFVVSDDKFGCLDHRPIVTTGATQIGASGGLLTAAELLPFQETEDPNYGPECALVLHAGAAIWVDEADVTRCLPRAGAHTIFKYVDVEKLAWSDVIDGAPGRELVLVVSSRRATAQMGDATDITRRDQIVCGVGASRIPRCTPGIPMHVQSYVSDREYGPTISRHGVLRFTVEDHGYEMFDDEEEAKYRRSHVLQFP